MSAMTELFIRPMGPQKFARRRRPKATTRVVVCAGDSLTEGWMSANFLTQLSAQLAPSSYTLVNAGVGGDLAANVLERLDSVIACEPDFVTLLIGTNDVLAGVSDEWLSYYEKTKGLRQAPTPESFVETVSRVLDRLLTETSAHIAVVEIPPIGEDLDSATNKRVRDFNSALRAAAQTRGLPTLPLFSRMSRVLGVQTSAAFNGSRMYMLSALVRRRVLQQSWSDISARNGLHLLTDHVHLNYRGAALIAALVREFLLESRPSTAP